jgi:hypothetical protein
MVPEEEVREHGGVDLRCSSVPQAVLVAAEPQSVEGRPWDLTTHSGSFQSSFHGVRSSPVRGCSHPRVLFFLVLKFSVRLSCGVSNISCRISTI